MVLAGGSHLAAYPDILLRLFIDLVAVSVLTTGLFLRRYGRRDRVVSFIMFNLGLFAVLTVITSKNLTTGVGFGLFAILSLIRLRSVPFSNVELGYFFSSLAIGLVDGFARHDTPLVVGLDVLLIVAMFLVDHPSLHTTILRRRVVLDRVVTDTAALKDELSAALGLEIVQIGITDIDYVRETTRVTVRYIGDPRSAVEEPEPQPT